MSAKVRDILVRAAKTAVQTFLASASVGGLIAGDFDALRAAAVAAVAAGLSVLWNAALAWSSE